MRMDTQTRTMAFLHVKESDGQLVERSEERVEAMIKQHAMLVVACLRFGQAHPQDKLDPKSELLRRMKAQRPRHPC